MLIDMCLPKFDIHQSAQTIDVLISFKKKTSPDGRSEIFPRNIFTRQSAWSLKKLYSGLVI